MKCKFCQLSMEKGAVKCPNCSSFQGWKRYVYNINLALAVLVALISILSAKPVIEFFEEKRAEINVSILDGSFSEIEFLIANIGNRPTAVVQIELRTKQGASGVLSTYFLGNELKNRLLLPGEAVVIIGKNGDVIPKFIPHEVRVGVWNNRDCELVIVYVQLNGVKESLVYPFSCSKLQ